ncbi:Hpt domain-containing protein [Monaibacterium marinum]|nr:Hpt domain-containing protein [Monaibacterium marinum]
MALETAINTISPKVRDIPETAAVPDGGAVEPPVFAYMARSIVDELLNFLSPDDLVDCVSEYIADTRSRLAKLAEANNAGDRNSVVSQAHSLRGSSVTLGFTDIAARAAIIEGQTEQLDQVSVASLEHEITEMIDQIAAVL